MSLYYSSSWKKYATPFLRPAVKFLKKNKVTPNMLTFAAFIFGLIFVYFFLENYALFLTFYFLHKLMDLLDGQLARYTKKATKKGSIYDKTSDTFVAFLFYLKFLYFSPFFTVAFVGITLFLIHILISKNMWHTVFAPNNNILVVFSIFKYYELGLFLQALFYIFVIITATVYKVQGKKA